MTKLGTLGARVVLRGEMKPFAACACQLPDQPQGKERRVEHPAFFHMIQILAVSALVVSFQLPGTAQGTEHRVRHPTFYRTTQINGLSILYREAGSKDARDRRIDPRLCRYFTLRVYGAAHWLKRL
jgi:hypothetical protein